MRFVPTNGLKCCNDVVTLFAIRLEAMLEGSDGRDLEFYEDLTTRKGDDGRYQLPC